MIAIQEFQHLNSFYQRPESREVIYDLYKGVCQGCRKTITSDDFDKSHIIPRSKPEQFESLFPGLDVDNLLNLYLLCQKCNRSIRDFYVDSPALLHKVYSYSSRLIATRLHKVRNPESINIDLLRNYTNTSIIVDLENVYQKGFCYGDYHKLPFPEIVEAIKQKVEIDGYSQDLEYRLAKHLFYKSTTLERSGYIWSREAEGRPVTAFFNRVSQGLEKAQESINKKNELIREHYDYSNEIISREWFYLPGPISASKKVLEITWRSENDRTVNNLIHIYNWGLHQIVWVTLLFNGFGIEV